MKLLATTFFSAKQSKLAALISAELLRARPSQAAKVLRPSNHNLFNSMDWESSK